jgi:hypothetical protein
MNRPAQSIMADVAQSLSDGGESSDMSEPWDAGALATASAGQANGATDKIIFHEVELSTAQPTGDAANTVNGHVVALRIDCPRQPPVTHAMPRRFAQALPRP